MTCAPYILVTHEQMTYLQTLAARWKAVQSGDVAELLRLGEEQRARDLTTDMGYDDCPVCQRARAMEDHHACSGCDD